MKYFIACITVHYLTRNIVESGVRHHNPKPIPI